MRRNVLIVLLAVGTVAGYASGIRSMVRWHYYKHHGGYAGCHAQPDGWRRWQSAAPAGPAAEKGVTPPSTPSSAVAPASGSTVNIYVQSAPQQQPPAGTPDTADKVQ